MELRHDSVLFREAVEGLSIVPGDVVVDATVGGAGHFKALYTALNGSGTLIGIDADGEAIARGHAAVQEASGTDVRLVEGNFRDLDAIVEQEGVTSINKALFDLGWSGYHLGSGRGFSFRVDEPLVMTYGTPEEGETAADVVNTLPEEALADIIFTLGEERFARQIARGIARVRREKRILSTKDLVDAICASTPSWYQHRRIHPATKTFQALRMHVNDELGALRKGLSSALTLLVPGGRVAVITFHSIEDRIVKSMLRDAAHEGRGAVLTKKPIVPTDAEAKENPRARSAKLRIFEKCAHPSAKLSTSTHYAYV